MKNCKKWLGRLKIVQRRKIKIKALLIEHKINKKLMEDC